MGKNIPGRENYKGKSPVDREAKRLMCPESNDIEES